MCPHKAGSYKKSHLCLSMHLPLTEPLEKNYRTFLSQDSFIAIYILHVRTHCKRLKTYMGGIYIETKNEK